MTYASLDDLIARAGLTEILQVADRDGDEEPDADVVDAALIHADNIVNGYVAARYTLPLANTPDLVRTWSVSIARHYLHREGPPDYVQADYKDAMAGLRDVARGVITLPDTTGQTPVASSGTHLSESPPEVFTRENLRGW